MSAFSSLSAFGQTVIPLLLFAEAVLELGLFLYQILRSKQPLRSLPCNVHFVILLTLLFSVTQGDPDEGKNAFLTGAPWLLFAAVIVLVAIHFVIALPREYRRRKNELSPFSIKEATDKLPMGICFADPDGRIILCNNRMRRLSFALSGHELQITEDLEAALARPDPSVTVKDDCYTPALGHDWVVDALENAAVIFVAQLFGNLLQRVAAHTQFKDLHILFAERSFELIHQCLCYRCFLHIL